jgi:perosamine synthetase
MDYSYRGVHTKLFENEVSDRTGLYTVATNSGTAALFISLKLAGIKKGDLVLCPAVSFVATANSIKYLGAEPVFCDCDHMCNIDIYKLEKWLKKNYTSKIKAIIPVHICGYPVERKHIKSIAKKYKLKIVEDCCQAFGSKIDGKHVGDYDVAGALSFNGNKLITTGGGGAILTKSKKLASKANHLIQTAKDRTKKQSYHNELGYNLKMPAWNAMLGLVELEKLTTYDKYKKVKIRNREYYDYWCIKWVKDNTKEDEYIIWTPLYKLPYYRKCVKMDMTMTEEIAKHCIIKGVYK